MNEGRKQLNQGYRIARGFVHGVDHLTDGIAFVLKFLVLALILVLFVEVVSRYVFNRPTFWALETSKMLLGVIGTWGWAYTLKLDGHVRVDVFYSMLPRRGRAAIDVALSIAFLLPMLYAMIYAGSRRAARSWATGERMIESNWLPPAAPFRTLLVAGFVLFALQCVARFVRDLYALVKNEDMV